MYCQNIASRHLEKCLQLLLVGKEEKFKSEFNVFIFLFLTFYVSRALSCILIYLRLTTRKYKIMLLPKLPLLQSLVILVPFNVFQLQNT